MNLSCLLDYLQACLQLPAALSRTGGGTPHAVPNEQDFKYLQRKS